MIVKIMVVRSGWMICQSGPRIVCLYCATKSRHTKSMVRSRYRHKSTRCRSSQPVFGLMIRSHSSVADGWDLLIENANHRRRIAEFGQRRDFAVPPPLHVAELPCGG